MRSIQSFAAALFAFAMMSISTASAQETRVLLNVNVSTPGNYVVSTTGATPLTSTSGSLLTGVVLEDIFTTDFPRQNNAIGGSLKPAGVSAAFIIVDNNAIGAPTALNIRGSGSSSETMQFSTSSPAFSGTATITSFGDAAPFPAIGTVGDITLRSSGVLIGQYQIVPEPASLSLLATAATTLGLARRRRRR